MNRKLNDAVAMIIGAPYCSGCDDMECNCSTVSSDYGRCLNAMAIAEERREAFLKLRNSWPTPSPAEKGDK